MSELGFEITHTVSNEAIIAAHLVVPKSMVITADLKQISLVHLLKFVRELMLSRGNYCKNIKPMDNHF